MNAAPYPPAMIVVHKSERRSKCSVEPLRGKAGFVFLDYPSQEYPSLEGYVRLGFGGPLLSDADASAGLLILDASWRNAEKMERDFKSAPVRALPPWRTAYPRVSKTFADPKEGLATIEAIVAAHWILRRPIDGLLDEYYWAEEFRSRNADRLGFSNSASERASDKPV